VEQFERIRRDQRDEGLSVRALAARHRVHRRTVRQALEDAVPPAPKAPVRVSPALGPREATVRGWLVADLDAPRKQRHTARRVWRNLPHWHRPGQPAPVRRSCTISSKKSILVPLVNVECSVLEGDGSTPAQLREKCCGIANQFTNLSLTIDGSSVPNLTTFRVVSGAFKYTMGANNPFGADRPSRSRSAQTHRRNSLDGRHPSRGGNRGPAAPAR
jgi:hypothetical protein